MADNRTFDMQCVDLAAALLIAMPGDTKVVAWSEREIEHQRVEWSTINGLAVPTCFECGTQGEPR